MNRQPHDPRLPDLRNLRDIGGLRTADGRRVRSGVVLRSATPSLLDERQVGVLAEELGVRTRVDLRSASEIEESRNPVLDEAIAVEHLRIRSGGEWRHRPDLDHPSHSVAEHYLHYLQHSGDSLAALVRLVAVPERGAFLVHCTAGKDRTGVSLAVLLSAVGVTDEEIVGDYGRTRDDLDALLLQLRGLPAYEERLAALPEESLTAEPASMERFLQRLAETYGSARGYLTDAGVDEATLERAAGVLLEDGGADASLGGRTLEPPSTTAR